MTFQDKVIKEFAEKCKKLEFSTVKNEGLEIMDAYKISSFLLQSLQEQEQEFQKTLNSGRKMYNMGFAKAKEMIVKAIEKLPAITRAISANESAQYISKDSVISLIKQI